MLNTIGEIISTLRTAIRQKTADTRLTDRDIYSVVASHAYWIVDQEATKLQITKQENLFQQYSCLDIIEVPITDECCKYQSQCKIYRTKNKLPEFYSDSNGAIIRSVTSTEWSTDLTRTTLERWIKTINDPNYKYNKSKYFFYRNGYLYFPNIKWKSVTVFGFFKDELHVPCTECDTQYDCMFEQDKSWRVPDKIKARIKDAALKELVEVYLRINPDHQVDKQESAK
jgi:hypothetical protein